MWRFDWIVFTLYFLTQSCALHIQILQGCFNDTETIIIASVPLCASFLQCRKVVLKFKIQTSNFVNCSMRCLVWAGKTSWYFVCAFDICSCLKSAKFEKWDLNSQICWEKTNSQNVINEICPHESVEHHRGHRRRNREINQFCLGPNSKYLEIWYRCVAGHYPVWAGSRSWVRRHRSLHISIKGMG